MLITRNRYCIDNLAGQLYLWHKAFRSWDYITRLQYLMVPLSEITCMTSPAITFVIKIMHCFIFLCSCKIDTF